MQTFLLVHLFLRYDSALSEMMIQQCSRVIQLLGSGNHSDEVGYTVHVYMYSRPAGTVKPTLLEVWQQQGIPLYLVHLY